MLNLIVLLFSKKYILDLAQSTSMPPPKKNTLLTIVGLPDHPFQRILYIINSLRHTTLLIKFLFRVYPTQPNYKQSDILHQKFIQTLLQLLRHAMILSGDLNSIQYL